MKTIFYHLVNAFVGGWAVYIAHYNLWAVVPIIIVMINLTIMMLFYNQ